MGHRTRNICTIEPRTREMVKDRNFLWRAIHKREQGSKMWGWKVGSKGETSQKQKQKWKWRQGSEHAQLDGVREKDTSKNQTMETLISPSISSLAKPVFDLSIIVCNPIYQMISPRFLSDDIGFWRWFWNNNSLRGFRTTYGRVRTESHLTKVYWPFYKHHSCSWITCAPY